MLTLLSLLLHEFYYELIFAMRPRQRFNNCFDYNLFQPIFLDVFFLAAIM